MKAFGNRARAALVALGEMKGATKKPVAKPSAAPAQKLPDVLKRMNDYLDNPPKDYNVKQVEVIRDWATKQEARLNEAKAKYKEGQADEWERLDDLRFETTMLKAKATKAIKTEAEVAAHHAEQGGPRYNAQSERGRKVQSGTLGDPILADRKAGSKEDQAFVEKLIERGVVRPGGRAVASAKPTAAQLRAERVAGRFDKRIVWVEGLNGDGLTLKQAAPDRIFLDPDSGRSAQVLTAHELAHHLQASNPDGFAALVKKIDKLMNDEKFVKMAQRLDPNRELHQA